MLTRHRPDGKLLSIHSSGDGVKLADCNTNKMGTGWEMSLQRTFYSDRYVGELLPNLRVRERRGESCNSFSSL